MKLLSTLMVILLSLSTFAQTPDNAELTHMYKEDQSKRSAPQIDWSTLTDADSTRRKRVYELINNKEIITAKDNYHAAMIFQHGKDSVAFGMAVKFMRKAIELDSTTGKWLLAAAIDRELQSRRKPQIYGTQYVKMGQHAKFEQYLIDTTQVSDEERKLYGVKTLAEQRESIRLMNLPLIGDYHASSGTIENTISFIKSEIAKGANSAYNVSEEAINSLGYQLLNTLKNAEALKIFKLNTLLFPASSNTYDSLGECLLKSGRKEEGLAAYKKSLELNPKNETAKKLLLNAN